MRARWAEHNDRTPLPVWMPAVPGASAIRLNHWFNDGLGDRPAAFTSAPGFTLGNVSRTINCRMPPQYNVDVALRKYIQITEKHRLAIRVEAINATNTPKFTAPESRWGNSSFGTVATEASFPRIIQYMLRYEFLIRERDAQWREMLAASAIAVLAGIPRRLWALQENETVIDFADLQGFRTDLRDAGPRIRCFDLRQLNSFITPEEQFYTFHQTQAVQSMLRIGNSASAASSIIRESSRSMK